MTTSIDNGDKSTPYYPLAGQANDGYSKEGEATATCFCGAVQLAVVSLLHLIIVALGTHLIIRMLSPPKRQVSLKFSSAIVPIVRILKSLISANLTGR